MAIVSPSHPRPAVIYKTSISVIGAVRAEAVMLEKDLGRNFSTRPTF
jgi:hypothetical protein